MFILSDSNALRALCGKITGRLIQLERGNEEDSGALKSSREESVENRELKTVALAVGEQALGPSVQNKRRKMEMQKFLEKIFF